MNPSRTACLLAILAVLVVVPAEAYVLADTCGHQEPGCPVLHWEEGDDPIPFRLHHAGGLDLSSWSFETLARMAFATWAEVPTADLEFEEGGLFMGAADFQTTEAIDRQSVLFFKETGWAPRSPEVIALTSITFAEGGVILEADIGFNAEDWTFTVGEENVQVDFLSIAVHEIGHFLGLDHSEVEGATMNARYDEGDVSLRTLTDDDRAGISELYPCAQTPCVGDVGPGCSVLRARSRGLLVGMLLMVCFFGVRTGRRWMPFLLVTLALGLPTSSVGSVVEALDVDDLSARADLVVRADVAAVTPYLEGRVRSAVRLDVTEAWKGLPPESIVLDQEGGRLPEVGTLVFGMPRFQVGEDVVVYLDWPEGGDPRVLGLAQGKFRVENGVPVRDLAGLSLAHRAGSPAAASSLPGGLDELRFRAQ